jgi:hypothetical protein
MIGQPPFIGFPKSLTLSLKGREQLRLQMLVLEMLLTATFSTISISGKTSSSGHLLGLKWILLKNLESKLK